MGRKSPDWLWGLDFAGGIAGSTDAAMVSASHCKIVVKETSDFYPLSQCLPVRQQGEGTLLHSSRVVEGENHVPGPNGMDGSVLELHGRTSQRPTPLSCT